MTVTWELIEEDASLDIRPSCDMWLGFRVRCDIAAEWICRAQCTYCLEQSAVLLCEAHRADVEHGLTYVHAYTCGGGRLPIARLVSYEPLHRAAV